MMLIIAFLAGTFVGSLITFVVICFVSMNKDNETL